MLSEVDANGAVWVAGGGEEGECFVKSDLGRQLAMLDEDWYLGGGSVNPSPAESALLQPVDSSSSCSPPPYVASNLDLSSLPFFPHKSGISSLLSALCPNPFDPPPTEFLGYEGPAFLAATQGPDPAAVMFDDRGGCAANADGGLVCLPELCPPAGGPELRLPLPRSNEAAGLIGFAKVDVLGGFDGSAFLSRPKVLQPLEVLPPVGAQPTLFQKRAAALRRRSGLGDTARAITVGSLEGGNAGDLHGQRGQPTEDDTGGGADDIDGTPLNYDSDAAPEENPNADFNANGGATATGGDGGDRKGKKRGMPAKNLMAERRRRKKLNDRLYMLRSVVPKISKMDRASILGDAIEYLKELLQKITDLQSELESPPCASPLTGSVVTAPAGSFHPPTPTAPSLPWRVKEELCPSPLGSPCALLPTVEVRERDGQAVNIHMFCARRPGLLLSTMRALDSLGLDIHQAVISCFNGFALDVFRAEQCKNGPGARTEEIKALLLHTANCHGAM